MNRIKLGALALTTALAITAGVTSLVAPEPAKAEAQTVNWSGQTRTLSIWPTEAPQAVGVGVAQVRITYPGTITRLSVGPGWKVTDRTASSFELTNTSAFVARGWDRDAVSSVSIRVDGRFKAEPSSVEKLRGGSALMTGDDLDRGRLSFR
jgi:hypothetical protein